MTDSNQRFYTQRLYCRSFDRFQFYIHFVVKKVMTFFFVEIWFGPEIYLHKLHRKAIDGVIFQLYIILYTYILLLVKSIPERPRLWSPFIIYPVIFINMNKIAKVFFNAFRNVLSLMLSLYPTLSFLLNFSTQISVWNIKVVAYKILSKQWNNFDIQFCNTWIQKY